MKKTVTSPMQTTISKQHSPGPHMGLKMDSMPTAAFDTRSTWKAPKGRKGQDFTSPMEPTIKTKKG
jgi:hypothetical protein